MGGVATFFSVGLLAVMIDVPFDILGPDLGWWWWNEDAEDPMGLVAHRWLGVPVSSYCWHLLFEGSQWLVAHRLRARVRGWIPRGTMATVLRALPLAAIAGALSIVVGVIVMMPFHLFRGPLGFSDGVFTVTLLVVASLALLLGRKRGAGEGGFDWGLLSWGLAWNFFFAALVAWRWLAGDLPQGDAKLLVIGAVAVGSVVIHTYIHARACRPGAEPRH
jgi:hypothetical protein